MAKITDDETGQPASTPASRIGKLPPVLLAIAIGAAGGAAFNWLTMPLPWLLGPMVFNTVAAVVRAPILPPTAVRPYVVVVIGVMLGSGFSAEIIRQAGDWLMSMGFLAAYLLVSGALTVPYYRRVGGLDWVTAYFAGMPGGLNEMVLIGKDMGGDDRRIVLAHASRIFIVVCLIAVWFRLIAGLDLGNRAQFGVPFSAIAPADMAILAGCGIAGFFLGRLLRLPAPTLVGPMLVSAGVHIAGLSGSPPPAELVIVAQIFLGTILGCRFIGADAKSIGRAILLSLGATFIMLAVTLIFAVLFHGLFGQPVEQVLLAYSPGGLAEMSLVALAMNAEVAYVASHHIVRIAIVILVAPLVFSALRRRIAPEAKADDED